jgi:hypothetical protein
MPWPLVPKEEMKVFTPDDGGGGTLSFDDTDYDATTLNVLIKAYDDALHELEIMNVPARSRDGDGMGEKLARRILKAAADGERDPERLKLLALHAIDGR